MYASLQHLISICTFIMVFISFLNMSLHTFAFSSGLKILAILLILSLKSFISMYLNMCKIFLKIYLNLSNELCSASLFHVCNITYSTYSCGIQILRKMTLLTTRYMQWKNYSFKPPSQPPSVLVYNTIRYFVLSHTTIFFLHDRENLI